jgi:hypothetical protein
MPRTEDKAHATPTHTAQVVEVIRTMTPVEFVRSRGARDARERRVTDLTHFVYFMVGELRGGPLSDLTAEGTERLVAAYIESEARTGTAESVV